MAEFPIPPEVTTVALAAYHTHPGGNAATRQAMEAAIRAALNELGLRDERLRCNCEDGHVENGPPGATYTVAHARCGGTGWYRRLTGPDRPHLEGPRA